MISEYEVLPILNHFVSFWLPVCWLYCQQGREMEVDTKQCHLCHSRSWKTVSLLSYLYRSASLRKLYCSHRAILFSSSSFSLGNSTGQCHLDTDWDLSLLFNWMRKFGRIRREYFCTSTCDTVYSSVTPSVYLYSLLPSSFMWLLSDTLLPLCPVGHFLLDGGVLLLGWQRGRCSLNVLYVIDMAIGFSDTSKWNADKSGQADRRNVLVCHK